MRSQSQTQQQSQGRQQPFGSLLGGPELEQVKTPDPNIFPGHTAGDGWWGFSDPLHYGAYCGPGSQLPLNSRGIDWTDEAGREHDNNYNQAHISADTMWSSGDAYVKTRQADELLANETNAAMQMHPEQYSPSARVYQQGIKSIFGEFRPDVAAGVQKWRELESGVGGAAHQSMQWTGSRINEAENGVGGAARQAANWTGSRLGEMGSGIGGAAHQSAQWTGNRLGEMGSGVGGAAQQATNWTGSRLGEAQSGIGGFVQQASHWRSPEAVVSGVEGGVP